MVEGTTGLFFREQTPEALAEAIARFDDGHFDPLVIRKHAIRFGCAAFQHKFGQFVLARYREFSTSQELA